MTGARACVRQNDEYLTMGHLTTVYETTMSFIEDMTETVQKQRARKDIE